MRLVLASSSPRRARLLELLGLDFDTEVPGVDETRRPDEDPPSYVERLARAKATEVAGPGRVVVGADTVVVHRGRVMGKPAHPEEARTMLRSLSGNTHEVFTGLAVAAWVEGAQVRSVVDVTHVEILPLTAEEIDDYVGSGEAMGKAGAYALQGVAGRFVRRIEGSPFTVIGLPLHLLSPLLQAVGYPLKAFTAQPRG